MSFLAGKPRVPKPGGANSLEPGDWEEDEGADGLDEGCDALDLDDDGESEGWEPEESEDEESEASFECIPCNDEYETPKVVGNVFRSPLIPTADGLQGSPLSMASGESMTDSIRKQQMEFREPFAPMASSSTTPTSI